MERHTESYTEFRNVSFYTYKGKDTGSKVLALLKAVSGVLLDLASVYYLFMLAVVYALIKYREDVPKLPLICGAALVGLLLVFFWVRVIKRARRASVAYMKESDGTVWKVRFRALLRRVGSWTVVDTVSSERNASYYEVIATAIAEIKSGQRNIFSFNMYNKVSKISDLEMVEEKKKYYICRGRINGRKPREFKIYKCYGNIEGIFD